MKPLVARERRDGRVYTARAQLRVYAVNRIHGIWKNDVPADEVCRRSAGTGVDIFVSLHQSIRMRTTLNLADDVYEAVKVLAEGSGSSLGEVISELARRGLRPREVAADTGDDLPAFRVRHSAAIIPSNRASELLGEEGAD